MSDIETGRDRLYELADELRAGRDPLTVADEIDTIIEETLYRVSPARRTPVASRKMTAALGRRARKMAGVTKMSNAQIAGRLGVNPGRVSEALNGQW